MDFNPRSPCGERQSPQTVREGVITYFNPRSPCGERLAAVMIDGEATLFQSTLSLRRATIPPGLHHFPNRNFNPRSPCGERPGPLTGPAPLRYFNPRSPCGERPSWQLPFEPSYPFQSTLSLRRATSGSGSNWSRVAYFNPRSPCGERLRCQYCIGQSEYISIHALLAESDADSFSRLVSTSLFQSTLSLRRATRSVYPVTAFSAYFNPRSPCGERQCLPAPSAPCPCNFNPRSPCGERRKRHTVPLTAFLFQSTLSLRRATRCKTSMI